APSGDHFTLALLLEPEGALDGPEGVHVLDLDLGTNEAVIQGPDRDIGVAPERAILHVAGGCPDVAQNATKSNEIFARLFGRREVRLADDFHQRHTRAVEIDQRAAIVGMHEPTGVFLNMHAGDATSDGAA